MPSDIERYAHYRHLSFTRTGAVLTVRLNRPHAYNAINPALHEELSRVFADIAGDDDTRAVVLTGEGKAFCAGGDINEVPNQAGPALDRFFREARKIIIDLLELPQPIIAAINGPAVGLGATLALFCDLTFAAEHALIADPHVTVGVVAGDGGAVIWPWLIGANRAKQYLLTGDKLSAREAERIGLINQVVDADELFDTAHGFAARLADSPQRAIRGTKAAVNALLRDAANLILDACLATEKECFTSGDHSRAVTEFQAKRQQR